MKELFHLGGLHSNDTSKEEMDSDEDRRLTVHRTSGDRNMSITGILHRSGRLRENMSSKSDGNKSLTVDCKSSGMSTTSEYMDQV